ncbi:MAG: hypothetical protein GYB66_08840, partial [Chloroflexi bacterium]|nr:hypothetical protein [Chloroflexota bacterium]
AGIWFWRKRDGFVPHPGVEASGYRLHLLALVIAGVVIVAAVVNTIDEMDSLLESQARDFRELDRVSREMQ